jgi:ABC-2 type transport system permease protein
MRRLQELYQSRELLVNLTLRELRSRYRRSVLGWTWSLLNPLAMVAIYGIVFSVFLKVEPPVGEPSGLDSFVMYLLCALVPWNFFSIGLSQSVEALVSNANLIRKVYFPRELLVFASVGAALVTFLIELAVVCVVLLLVGNFVLVWLPVLIVLIALQSLIITGLGLILSACNVYFHDVRHFLVILLQIMFYATPIVYPITLVPENSEILGVDVPVRALYQLNPMVEVVQAFRRVLYDLRFPTFGQVAYMLVWAIGAMVIGMWVFRKLEKRVAEEV